MSITMYEFITLVEDMRTTQKEYFKTRSIKSLKLSKELERQVDKALVAVKSCNPQAVQGSLL